MRINREKILSETCGTIDKPLAIMDSLCAALEYYIDNDKVSNGYGAGCFTNPEGSIREFLESEGICEYVDFGS